MHGENMKSTQDVYFLVCPTSIMDNHGQGPYKKQRTKINLIKCHSTFSHETKYL